MQASGHRRVIDLLFDFELMLAAVTDIFIDRHGLPLCFVSAHVDEISRFPCEISTDRGDVKLARTDAIPLAQAAQGRFDPVQPLNNRI